MSSISPSPASSIPILPSPPFSGSPPPASRTSPPSPSNSTAPPSLPTPSPLPPSPPSSSPPTSDAPPPNIAPPPDLSVSVPPPVPMATPPMVTSNRTENPPPPPNVPSASPVTPNATQNHPPPPPTTSPVPPNVPSEPPSPPNPPLAPPPPHTPNVPDGPPPTSDPSPPPPSPPEVPSVPPPTSSSNTTSPPPPTPLISPPPPPPNATQPTPSNSPPPPRATPPDNSPPPPPSATPPEASPPPPPQPMPPNNSPPPPPSTTPPQATPPENSPPSVMPPEALPSPPVPPGPLPPSPPAPIQLPSSPGNGTGPNPPSSVTPTPLAPSPPSNSSGGGFSNPAPVPTIPSPGRQPPSDSGGGGIPTGGRVAIGVGVALILLSLIGLVIWCLRKQKRKGARQNGGYVVPSYDPSESPDLKSQSPVPFLASDSSGVNSPALGSSRSWFTYQELEEITNGFSSENLLGEGGFGPVYKGCLADGREIAVKQLKIGGGQGEREFRAEVDIISRIHHRHLVSLVGYCISDNQRLLVYDYVPNNNLHYHLHGKDRPVMDWKTRSRVAAGAARGIAYLHEDCQPRIIHRDIKSSNILLDNNFEAQVSDFGLAKLALDGSTHVSTRVVGTFGYMAPEYARSGKLTDKSDVFSFGVVLLELITGRKPVDTSLPLGDESLVEWARPLLSHAIDKGEFEGLVDPRLENNYDQPEMFRMIEAAATCVRHSAEKRPRMGQVMRVLDSLGYSSSLNNGTAPGSSEAFNTAEHSFMRRMAFGPENYSTDFFSQDS